MINEKVLSGSSFRLFRQYCTASSKAPFLLLSFCRFRVDIRKEWTIRELLLKCIHHSKAAVNYTFVFESPARP